MKKYNARAYVARKKIWGHTPGENIIRGDINHIEMSYAEIAAVMHITPQRVHQLERQALWKLRHSGLAQYWRDLKGIS